MFNQLPVDLCIRWGDFLPPFYHLLPFACRCCNTIKLIFVWLSSPLCEVIKLRSILAPPNDTDGHCDWRNITVYEYRTAARSLIAIINKLTILLLRNYEVCLRSIQCIRWNVTINRNGAVTYIANIIGGENSIAGCISVIQYTIFRDIQRIKQILQWFMAELFSPWIYGKVKRSMYVYVMYTYINTQA